MIASYRFGQLMDVIMKKYFWVLNLVVVGLCATLAGRATAGLLVSSVLTGNGPRAPGRAAPVPPGDPPHQKDVELILKRNIFCSTCAPIAPVVEQQEGPVDTSPQKSALQLQLLVTMVSPDDINSSLEIVRDLADEKKKVGVYRRGNSLPGPGSPGSVVVAQVVQGRLYLVNGKRVEFIDQDGMPPPPVAPVAVASTAEPTLGPGETTGLEKDIEKGIRCTGSNCEVDKTLIDKVLANTTALATSARFVPSSKDGKPNGFKVYAIRPGSVFAKIGMQNADLVKAINGLDMSTPDKAFEAYTKLKSASHLTVALERRNENITLDYQIR